MEEERSEHRWRKRLSHLRFANEVILVSGDPEELGDMLREFKKRYQAVGLKMNFQKTKIVSQNNIQVTLDNHALETVNEYVYLGPQNQIG